MKKLITLFIALFLFSVGMHGVAQTAAKVWTRHNAKEWFNKKEWLGALHLQPHKTVNKVEFARQYQVNKVYWDKAFNFLQEQNLQTLAAGNHPIDGDNVFVIVTQNPTKDYDSTAWESHIKYIDLQYVISGEEKIAVHPITKLKITKPYDASKDIVNYSGEGNIYTNVPETFFLFFPSDGHRPNITTGGNKADKKIIIKIRYAN